MKFSYLFCPLFCTVSFFSQAAVVFDSEGTKADVYGRVEFNINDESGKTQGIGSARLGFKGHSSITPRLQAIVRGEWEMVAENSGQNQEFELQNGSVSCEEPTNVDTCSVIGTVHADTSKSLTSRHVYAGFEIGEYGQLIFGQTETAFYDALASTDIFNSFGFEGSDIIYVGRQEGQIIYTANLADIHFSGSYQFHNDNATLQLGGSGGSDFVSGGQGTPVVLDNAFATTLGYNFSFGLSVFTAYSQENYETSSKKNWATSANYSKDSIYMALVIANSDINKANLIGAEAVVGYDFDPILLYGGYNKQEAKNITAEADAQAAGLLSGVTADAWLMGTQFDFNSNFIAWVEYKLENAKDLATHSDKDNVWSVALQYNF